MPLVAIALVAMLIPIFAPVPAWWSPAAFALFVAAMALYVRAGTPRGRPVEVASPVRGRWLAANSPTTQVPSHKIHAWSQTYAVDLVADPASGDRFGFSWWPLARRPEDYPGFGEPIHAPIDGTVVGRLQVMRDHWSRSSPPAVLYLVLESVRELLGPPGVLGNHLVIRGDDGAFVLLAHLRRRSVQVDRGDRVRKGDVVAECGNSGNSTEPHVHMQAMDTSSPWTAAGLPVRIDGRPPPANGDHLVSSVP